MLPAQYSNNTLIFKIMKKKLFTGLAVLVIATIVAWNVNYNSQDGMSDLALANVEALADSVVTGQCQGSVVFVTECYVRCPCCGHYLTPNPPQPNSTSHSVGGTCPVCACKVYK